MSKIHPEFISLAETCPEILIRADYSTPHNFTGEVVRGYRAQKAYLAKPSALALAEVQRSALERGLTLKIFDAYRPVKAVKFFQEWASCAECNPHLKAIYYPKFERRELFEKGFIAKESSHSRGSAVDLTLCDLASGRELDMGSIFDYFDELSHTEHPSITETQKTHRRLLIELMGAQGFRNFSQEWWHFSLRPGAFPDEAFDFDVE